MAVNWFCIIQFLPSLWQELARNHQLKHLYEADHCCNEVSCILQTQGLIHGPPC